MGFISRYIVETRSERDDMSMLRPGRRVFHEAGGLDAQASLRHGIGAERQVVFVGIGFRVSAGLPVDGQIVTAEEGVDAMPERLPQ